MENLGRKIEEVLATIKTREEEIERREVSIKELKGEVKYIKTITKSLRTQVKNMRLVEEYNSDYKETMDHFVTQKNLSRKHGLKANTIKEIYYRVRKKLRNELEENEEVVKPSKTKETSKGPKTHQEYLDRHNLKLIREEKGSYFVEANVNFPSGIKKHYYWISKNYLDNIIENWDKIMKMELEREYKLWFGDKLI